MPKTIGRAISRVKITLAIGTHPEEGAGVDAGEAEVEIARMGDAVISRTKMTAIIWRT